MAMMSPFSYEDGLGQLVGRSLHQDQARQLFAVAGVPPAAEFTAQVGPTLILVLSMRQLATATTLPWPKIPQQSAPLSMSSTST